MGPDVLGSDGSQTRSADDGERGDIVLDKVLEIGERGVVVDVRKDKRGRCRRELKRRELAKESIYAA